MFLSHFKKFNNKINDLINSKKGFDVLVVKEELQNIYDNYMFSLLVTIFDCLICPKCKKHFFNCEFGNVFIEHYPYERSIILNNIKIPIWISRVACPNPDCNGTHAIIPDCIIPYSQLTLKESIGVLDFELNHNEESSSPSLLVEPYAEKTVALFISYFNDYRTSFDLTADKTVVDLLDMLINDPFDFIRIFFDKCKKLFLVNREMLVDKNDNGKKVTAIYLSSA